MNVHWHYVRSFSRRTAQVSMTIRVRHDRTGVGVSCRVTSLEVFTQVINGKKESQRNRTEIPVRKETSNESTKEGDQELRRLLKDSIERKQKCLGYASNPPTRNHQQDQTPTLTRSRPPHHFTQAKSAKTLDPAPRARSPYQQLLSPVA